MGTASVGIVCRQPILREGLGTTIAAAEGLAVACSSAEELGAVATSSLDVIIHHLAEVSGDVCDLVGAACRKAPTCRILIMASDNETELAGKLLNAGAAGYVSNNCTGAELTDAVRTVLRGETYVSAHIASKVVGAFRAAALRKAAQRQRRFSVREEQIILHLLKGKTNKAIANDLNLSEKTVKHYMTLLMQKLAARNRLELAMTLRSEERELSAGLLN